MYSTQSVIDTFAGFAFQSVLSLVISNFLPPYQSTVVPTSLSELTASLIFPLRSGSSTRGFITSVWDPGACSVLYTRQNPHIPVT
jgi:hypothetical protein